MTVSPLLSPPKKKPKKPDDSPKANWLEREFMNRLKRLGLKEPSGDIALSLATFRAQRLIQTLTLALSAVFYRSHSLALTEAKTILSQALKAHLAASELDAALMEAVKALPFTEPSDLAANPDLFLAVSQSDVAGVVTVPTSGSTGEAKRIYSTFADLRNTEDFYYFGMRYMVSPKGKDLVALLMSGDRPGSVGDMLKRALERWPIEVKVPGFAPLGRPEFLEWFKGLISLKPTCLVGVPAQVLALANHELGQELTKTVKVVLLSGDVAPQTLVKAIESRLQKAKVFLHYGQTEFGLGGAVECPNRMGPHLREADLILEILDPHNQRVPPGEIGAMVITSLSREAMPLIRYRTGDLGSFVIGECPCGSIFRRIKTYGRLADRIAWPNGQTLDLWRIGEILYGVQGLVNYQALSPKEPDYILQLTVTSPKGPEPKIIKALEALLADQPWAIAWRESLSGQTEPTGKQVLRRS
ncbi:MAG: AMP-binding protein [Deltaproteobacteria bacterium]|jgi:phenylacetate-coenzyme A ligase PaaK-like adenylate-forming protein|nr:AMP-binding protein [Deltaproteobacteria bacterium]